MKRRRGSDDIKEKYKTKRFFQLQSARTQYWLKLDNEWLKKYLIREPDFY